MFKRTYKTKKYVSLFYTLYFLLLLFCSISVHAQKSYSNTLHSILNFKNYAGHPLSAKYSQAESVKVIYDLQQKQIFYINSNYYTYHYQFCNQILNYNQELHIFNEINYSNNLNKRFLLATINHFPSMNKYTMEIAPSDLMTNEEILHFYNEIEKSSFFGKELSLFLNNPRLLSEKEGPLKDIQTIVPSEIYNNLSFQVISPYIGSGNLHIIQDLDAEMDDIKPTDILVIPNTPVFLPEVAGVIVSEFQTPLSHLSILGRNRRIPILAYKNVYSDSAVLSMNNQKVLLDVQQDTFMLRKTKYASQIKRDNKQIKLKYNLSVDTLTAVKYLNRRSYKFVGNKAANFSVLFHLSQKNAFKVPENSFAIPFYFYKQHIIKSHTQTLIDNLLSEKDSFTSNEQLKERLKSIRKSIMEFPVDTTLIYHINQKVLQNPDYTKMRFRSSTNAEDAKGFSGAGLYDSKTGILNDNDKSFENAILKVWASLWSYNAFMEREYYHINHKDVYMGILVHRSFPEEAVNGVAVTKNIYRPDNYGFVVNAQLGNNNVVKPKEGVINDQFICYPNTETSLYKNKNTIEIITISNLNNDSLTMTPTEIQNLAHVLDKIKKYFSVHYFSSKYYLDLGLDLEFKLDGPMRDLYIKQVRPYND